MCISSVQCLGFSLISVIKCVTYVSVNLRLMYITAKIMF